MSGTCVQPHSRAVVSPVAGVGTLCTAAVTVHNATGPALKDVLADVLLPRPSEGATVVVTQDKQRGIVRMAVRGKEHRHQHQLLLCEGRCEVE